MYLVLIKILKFDDIANIVIRITKPKYLMSHELLFCKFCTKIE